MNLLGTRLFNQRLLRSEFRTPADVVRWLGAVQAQDYSAAKWAVGLRAPGASDASVERAFEEGAILRTHVLRPTWHFVAPSDIRWMLSLTGPRVQAANAYYYRTLELDPKTRRRSRAALERALRGGRYLTRAELAVVLKRARIATDGLRLAHLMADAELEAVVVSGPRRGKQFTYALLEERAPRAPELTRDEALAELARRYFTSHGPATLRDYAWWSGLTVREAKKGIELAALEEEELEGRTHWFAGGQASSTPRRASAHLLPNYDEYVIAYKDRGPVLGDSGRDVFANYFVVDGRLAGSWRRTATKDTVDVEAVPYGRLSGDARRALAAAANRYGCFLGLRGRLALSKK
jgi:hypothetical protein